MEERKLLKLLDDNPEGLGISDISYVLGINEGVLLSIIDELRNINLIDYLDGKYFLYDSLYHLGIVEKRGNNTKLITKDMQSVDIPNYYNDGQYVIYRKDRKGKYTIIYNVSSNKKKIAEVVKINNDTFINGYKIQENLPEGMIVEYSLTDDEVVIEEIVGYKDQPSTELLLLAKKRGIVTSYPKEVIEEAKDYPSKVDLIFDRVDLRSDDTISIDDITTNDLDDALFYVGKNSNNNDVVRISIADIPNYIKKGSCSDLHANSVGSSVYTPDGNAIHMFHPNLSQGICSLNSNVDRFARTFEIAFDVNGSIIFSESRTYLSVINSKKKMDKHSVDKVLSGEKVSGYEQFEKQLFELYRIAEKIREKRLKNGLAEFPSCDLKFVMSDDMVEGIKLSDRSRASSLVEQFMVSAGEFEGMLFENNGYKGIYRCEAGPNTTKVDEVIEALELHGVYIRQEEYYSNKSIQNILRLIKNKPYEMVFAKRLIRAMNKAYYSTTNIGHYSLANNNGYVQCTSPIRRVGDKENHRVNYNIEQNIPQTREEIKRLELLAQHLNHQERKITRFEEEANRLFACKYMSNLIGISFDASIFEFKKEGISILLPNLTEGIVKYKKPLSYDRSERHRIKINYMNTSYFYRIGDRIKVIVDSIDFNEKIVYYKIDEKVLIKK